MLDLSALEVAKDGSIQALAPSAGHRRYRHCANSREPAGCNWMIPTEDPESFCAACRLNEVIPDLSVPENPARWQRLEQAKRRLIYTLLKLRLPFNEVAAAPGTTLRFRFLSDPAPGKPVLTGHENGTITLNTVEADDAIREQRRVSLHEPFRTLLGHFRHEIGHFYWDRLIAGTPLLAPFRALFGDEQADYAAALRQHYEHGPDPAWVQHGVTAYASVHPWEDWAETWAHYLHIIDTIETAAGFGLILRPQHPAAESMRANPGKAATDQAGFQLILSTWFPLTYALNSLNRGMGLPDLYPFVLSDRAIEKLRFVHHTVEETQRQSARAA